MNKTVFLLTGFILSLGVTAADSATLTPEDVNSMKLVTAARMSPTGDRIGYLLQVPREVYKDDDGLPHHELHVTDLDGNSTPYVTGNIDITDIAWAADGESIFFLAKRDEEADFNSLYRIWLGRRRSRGAVYARQ